MQNNTPEASDSAEDRATHDLLLKKGAQLGYLIANSTMPDDIKESFVAVLPDMDLEQIDTLLSTLEAGFYDKATDFIDSVYKGDLEETMGAMTQNQSEAKK